MPYSRSNHITKVQKNSDDTPSDAELVSTVYCTCDHSVVSHLWDRMGESPCTIENCSCPDFVMRYSVDVADTGTDHPEHVNHPQHYGGDVPHEVIKCVNEWDLGRWGFNLGNAIKYIARAGKKDQSKVIEDLEKAKFYLDWTINALKKERDGNV